MVKDSSLNIPKFNNFTEACIYAHRFWGMLPSNATDLKTAFKLGSKKKWKEFIRARNYFITLRRQSVPKKEALEKVYTSYRIRLLF